MQPSCQHRYRFGTSRSGSITLNDPELSGLFRHGWTGAGHCRPAAAALAHPPAEMSRNGVNRLARPVASSPSGTVEPPSARRSAPCSARPGRDHGRGFRSAQHDLDGRPHRCASEPTGWRRASRSMGSSATGLGSYRAPSRRLAPRLPRFCAACCFYEHKPGPPRQSGDRSFYHLANGEDEKAATIIALYHEYCAVMDFPAKFCLQTVHRVLRTLAAARQVRARGRRIDADALRSSASMASATMFAVTVRHWLRKNCAAALGPT